MCNFSVSQIFLNFFSTLLKGQSKMSVCGVVLKLVLTHYTTNFILFLLFAMFSVFALTHSNTIEFQICTFSTKTLNEQKMQLGGND